MRRSLLVLTLLVLLAGGGYGVYWHETAREIEAGVPAWATAQREQGFALAWRTLDVGGFPFAFRLRIAAPVLRAERPFPYEAHGATLTATASPFDLRTWHVSAPDGATVTAATLPGGLEAASLEGRVALGGDMTSIVLAAKETAGTGVLRGLMADAFEVRLVLPQHAPTTHRDVTMSLTANVQQAILPAIPAPLSQRLASVSLAATVKGPWASGGFQRALVGWRDAGGTIELETAHVEWNGTVVDLSGTLALDGAMQPEGAMTASVAGADHAVDAAVTAGALQQRYADVAKSVLRAISAKDETGKAALHVPVSIQEQRVYIGPAAVAALPRIDWR
jgi:hypothetical protein